MSGTTYYQRNRETILNRAKDYYENNKKVLRERDQEISATVIVKLSHRKDCQQV